MWKYRPWLVIAALAAGVAGAAAAGAAGMSLGRWALLAALGLWLAGGVAGMWRLYGRSLAESWQGVRLPRPVVVIESDDWGDGHVLDAPDDRSAAADAEEALAVERLAALMARHRDSRERSAVFGAFVVAGQPQIRPILDDAEGAYHWLPVDAVRPKLLAALKAAEDDGTFSLLYHGRDHWNARAFCEAIRSRAAAGGIQPEALVDAVYPADAAGLDALMNEYFAVAGGRLVEPERAEIDAKVREGTAVFERVFARRPVGTVASRYLWGPQAERAWRASGIAHAHGTNLQRGPGMPHADMQRSRKLGFRTAEGLVGVPRTVRFDTSPNTGRLPEVAQGLAAASAAIEAGEPAVIETHSRNYYHEKPATREAMFERLDALLRRLERRYPDLVYLSPDEAGRLGERGRIGLNGRELKAASRPKHAWLWAYGLYLDRPKLRYWVWGALAMLAALACPFW